MRMGNLELSLNGSLKIKQTQLYRGVGDEGQSVPGVQHAHHRTRRFAEDAHGRHAGFAAVLAGDDAAATATAAPAWARRAV